MQVLPQSMHGISKRHTVSPYSIGMRKQARPNARSGRSTYRLAIIGFVESNSLRGKAVKIGCSQPL